MLCPKFLLWLIVLRSLDSNYIIDIDKDQINKILNENGGEFMLRLFIDRYKDEFAIFGISVKNNYIHYLDKKVITYTNIVGI